jgi:hypothetical protein
MSKVTRNNLVVVVVLLAFCAFVGGATQQDVSQEKTTNPYQNATVTIDASVVEVNLIGAAQLGLTPRSQKGESVSVEKIQATISKGHAKVTAGAKLAAQNSGSAEVKCSQSLNLGPNIYGTDMTFTIMPIVLSDGRISLHYKFTQHGLNKIAQADRAPDTFARNLEGNLCLDPGKPMIATGAQDGDEVYFLIITAAVEGK